MNFPTNLLFDIEVAKSRLRDLFEPVAEPESTDRRNRSRPTRSARVVVTGTSTAPEVSGCAAFGF
jgi:hypothetical protein